jgi:putative transposase
MELWHVLNRGVEGRDLYTDSQDYARFVHNMYEFNDARPAGNAYRLFDASMMDFRNPSWRRAPQAPLVAVHAWVLMKNHYHLLLSEEAEGGMSAFLRKLNVGYANYFNERHERSGTLFQGRTKKILISSEPHALYILHYIHLNPLDYCRGAESWRLRDRGTLSSIDSALAYLQTYRWSSYLDHTGVRNFPSILGVSRDSFISSNYADSLRDYLRDAGREDERMRQFALE